jgi:hypothetical protein
MAQKLYNWNTLNLKVFKKFGFSISRQETEALVNMVPDAVEKIMLNLKNALENLPSKLPAQGVAPQKYSNRENNIYQGNQMVDPEVIIEKDHTITQLKETIEILELKVKKLEQLVKLKDSKIANLSGKLQSMGITH